MSYGQPTQQVVKKSGKSPYEIRLDLLRLAYDITNVHGQTNLDKVIDCAKELNKFVCDDKK